MARETISSRVASSIARPVVGCDTAAPMTYSGSWPMAVARSAHSACSDQASSPWDLDGRLSVTASRSRRQRSRGVGSRSKDSTKRSSLSSMRSSTALVREENSASTSSGTPAISAMPLTGSAHSTPSDRVSSARRLAW